MMNNNVIGKAGLSALFPPRRKEDSLHDNVRVMIQRVKNDFFKGLDDEQLMCLPDHVRPRVPVTEEVYRAFVTKSARCRSRKLVFAYESEEVWGTEFREKLDKTKAEGGFGTLEAALKEAERLWRENSPAYQGYRSVAKPGKLPNGRRNIRRTRLEGDSEADYRRRLRETREAAAAANRSHRERVVTDYRREQSAILWQTLRPSIHALAKRLSEEGAAVRELHNEGVRQEIANHVDGYIPPQDDMAALMDRILLEVQRKLLDTE
ncbi:Hypp4550 [Branchiostoma lanceolatum]|uniref:Hypp4550 protein n=1 Tax=Branchiostoma lanceolatum TaxID=7740 RepID=A0A8K0F1Y0_BRALA|nr:Hypp4550 [Branchiostoma lanceolatum]